MADNILKIKIERIILHSGLEKSNDMLYSIVKVIQMRHNDVSKTQAFKITKEVLENKN